MSRGGAIAIFARTPGLGPVKTRLAADIGAQQALAFHRLAIAATAETVRRFVTAHPAWTARFAVAEAEGVGDAFWRPFPARHTGGGDLATRLWRVSEALLAVHGRVILIGADSPQITPADLEAAAAALERHAWVLGPAADGGFWCCGLARPLPRAVWRAAPFDRHADGSSLRVAAALIDAARAAGFPPPARLRRLHDVDTADDLDRLAGEWPDPAAQSPQQARLKAWIAALRAGGPLRPDATASATE